MDKTAIKNYAVDARKKLIDAVALKANRLYLFADSDKTLRPGKEIEQLRADGIFLMPEQTRARGRLYDELISETIPYRPDIFHRKIEEIAYTWFNRLIALRFMEINDYLPSGIRILSSKDAGRIEPDALRVADLLPFVDSAKVAAMRADTAYGAPERLYKYILISQCNALSDILPDMFQRINDYTELLLPDNLYTTGGIIHDLIHGIDEENFNLQHQGQIEIIGWLYQYYTSEKKDQVFAALKKNIKLDKDTIPAATQLFTPSWIVKYMVENSLGRLWLEKFPNPQLRNSWKYYVDEAEQTPEVAAHLAQLRAQNPINRPEDIKLIDPCMGSGHILVYAFDVLCQIYEGAGYAQRDIPNLILQHNLYGLDIDDRAGQLAYFALMMKARGYNRRFFRQPDVPQPMVLAVPESRQAMHIIGAASYLGAGMDSPDRAAAEADFRYLAEAFANGKELGSLIKIDRPINHGRLREYINDFPLEFALLEDADFDHNFERMAEAFEGIIKAADLLGGGYDVVVTNPPYAGSSGMGFRLSDFVKKNYPDGKSDLFAAFLERGLAWTHPHGYSCMVTMQSWMFLSSFETLRKKILASTTIKTLMHMENMVMGIAFGTAVANLHRTHIDGYRGSYNHIQLSMIENGEPRAFPPVGKRDVAVSANNFAKIPGSPIAYWTSQNFIANFEKGISVGAISDFTGSQHKTADNEQFLRLWWEVQSYDVSDGSKWRFYIKGGDFRRWYGNIDLVIDWSLDAVAFYKFNPTSNYLAENYHFKEGITYTSLSSSANGFRYLPPIAVFDIKGPSLVEVQNLYYVLGLFNTKVTETYLKTFNSTITLQVRDVKAMPILMPSEQIEVVESISRQSVDISRTDWDSFETSWDFQTHPFMQLHDKSLQAAYQAWEHQCNLRFATLKANEEELNRIFIDIYGLGDELTPEVQDKDVTVRKADLARDMRSFVSYAVGCMFGRYSLDAPGLAYAGGSFDATGYGVFAPVGDNLIPIGTADYFDNDIVSLFAEFLGQAFGEANLGENLDFVADALYPGAVETARERIRRYFRADFYKDHVKTYQKRPIYWLLDSGKKDGFKALFYLHRYDGLTMARARTDYLHPLQRKYEAEIKRLELLAGETEDSRERAASRKAAGVLQSQLDECRAYDQVLAHIAHQQIALDLDDGVKVNYAKFQGVEVPRDGGRVGKMDLLWRI